MWKISLQIFKCANVLYVQANGKSLHSWDCCWFEWCCFPLKGFLEISYPGDADFLSRQQGAGRQHKRQKMLLLYSSTAMIGDPGPNTYMGINSALWNPAPRNISEGKNSLPIVFLSKIPSRVLIMSATISKHLPARNCAQTSPFLSLHIPLSWECPVNSSPDGSGIWTEGLGPSMANHIVTCLHWLLWDHLHA